MLIDEIEWVRENPFEYRYHDFLIRIDVCDCETPSIRISSEIGTERPFASKHAPSLDAAIGAVLEGISGAIVIFTLKTTATPDFTIERELDDLWRVLHSLVAYQLRVQKALHLRITAPGSSAIN